jgi:hypothetical protein
MSEDLVEALEAESKLTQILQLVGPELEAELQTSCSRTAVDAFHHRNPGLHNI